MAKGKTQPRDKKRAALAAALQDTASLRPRLVRENEAARRFAVDAARLLHDDQCEDIVLLDLRGVSPICDYLVIATGTSDRQMRAVADHVEAAAKALGEKAYHVSGHEDASWIVVDYVDVVIHLFESELRLYYDLESLWGDNPRVDWGHDPKEPRPSGRAAVP